MTNEELTAVFDEIDKLRDTEDEDMSPTLGIIRNAKMLLVDLQTSYSDIPAPNSVIPNGEDGLIIEWLSPDKTKLVEVHYTGRIVMPQYLYCRSETYSTVVHEVNPESIKYYLKWEF